MKCDYCKKKEAKKKYKLPEGTYFCSEECENSYIQEDLKEGIEYLERSDRNEQ